MFYENFKRLCSERNTTPTAVAKAMGISTSMTANWKKGGMPRGDTLQKVADYFGVSTDSLLGVETITVTTTSGNTVAAEAFSAAADNYQRSLGEYKSKRRALVGLKAARGTKGSRAVKGMRTVKVGPDLDPNLVALLDRMTADQLADVERYAEFILSRKKG